MSATAASRNSTTTRSKRKGRPEELEGNRRLGRLHRQILAAVVAPDQSRPFDGRPGRRRRDRQDLSGRLRSGPRRQSKPGKTGGARPMCSPAKISELLDHYAQKPGIAHFDLLIDWGWFYFITRPMFKLIDWLYKLLGNFGLAILAGHRHRQAGVPAARQQVLHVDGEDEGLQPQLRNPGVTPTTR